MVQERAGNEAHNATLYEKGLPLGEFSFSYCLLSVKIMMRFGSSDQKTCGRIN
ncbi:hypothetical protein AJ85_09500 [Alkalihalobacillus alcalophilus ATCC 27647 = CGMCC 1.3604]|uniref:Uncharacterized protein n=1 Tax=Alkalihalobacillus alcalophilus ATCC 27647 = CGMCC 1.3604 TaxID=1218173 RepID=A0A4V6S0R0_ALKAL|nr:hypothetical protein [Alkalihalobacillus alcalophilus]MED1562500.1 hypothetical protein [Alkalihalobacillus alcalophilus]THG90652.1 hypothetical protein AJ85_09500 [Alkalihalobacillus alcalophilus ATCC 27647 = CGMCC 1.3604]